MGAKREQYAVLVHDRETEKDPKLATVIRSYVGSDYWFPVCECHVDTANEIVDAFIQAQMWLAHERGETIEDF